MTPVITAVARLRVHSPREPANHKHEQIWQQSGEHLAENINVVVRSRLAIATLTSSRGRRDSSSAGLSRWKGERGKEGGGGARKFYRVPVDLQICFRGLKYTSHGCDANSLRSINSKQVPVHLL